MKTPIASAPAPTAHVAAPAVKVVLPSEASTVGRKRLTPVIPTQIKVEVRQDEDAIKEIQPLTQEWLEELWKNYAEEHKENATLYNVMHDRRLEIRDQNNFDVFVPNLFLQTELEPFKVELLNHLRKVSGHQLLQLKLVVELGKKEQRAYSPQEKFEAMTKSNPKLIKLKRLFPEIDF